MRTGIRHLDGMVAVVTGVASGIGRALASGLAPKVCHLAAGDIDEDGLSRLQTELGQTGYEGTVTTHVANVGDEDRMRALAGEGQPYAIERITSYDMFPHTGHQELVAELTLRASRG